jgi:hypothetical protein
MLHGCRLVSRWVQRTCVYFPSDAAMQPYRVARIEPAGTQLMLKPDWSVPNEHKARDFDTVTMVEADLVASSTEVALTIRMVRIRYSLNMDHIEVRRERSRFSATTSRTETFSLGRLPAIEFPV